MGNQESPTHQNFASLSMRGAGEIPVKWNINFCYGKMPGGIIQIYREFAGFLTQCSILSTEKKTAPTPRGDCVLSYLRKYFRQSEGSSTPPTPGGNSRDVYEPGKCGLGSGRVFEMRARAKCGPGRLNLKIFFLCCFEGGGGHFQKSPQLPKFSPEKG